MAGWKDIFLGQIKFGLEKTNFITVNIISFIFNLYGKRIFKIDSDKIIEKTECRGDYDIFYLYPISLKEIDQDICLNLLKIEDGTINDLKISVPWKAILSEPTIITIEKINLVALFTQNTMDNINQKSIEDANSYLGPNNSIIKENQDLVNSYNEIKLLLTKYFSSINLEIKTINIILSDYFSLTINDIQYNNGIIIIDNATINSLDGSVKFIEINKIYFSVNDKKLSIHKIIIRPPIVENIPDFYTDDSSNDFEFTITIDILQVDALTISGIDLTINSHIITVNKLLSLNIEDILLFKNLSQNILLTLDTKKSTCIFENYLYLKISNVNQFTIWLVQIMDLIKSCMDKIIVISLNDSINSKIFCIENIKANVIISDDIFNVFLQKIYIDKIIRISDLELVYEKVNGTFKDILFEENGDIILYESFCRSDQFKILSNITKITKNEHRAPSGPVLDITFIKTTGTNIIQIINFVTEIIDKLTTKNNRGHQKEFETPPPNPNEQLVVNLNLHESIALLNYENNDFNIIFKNGKICITNKIATDISADVLMNGFLICRFSASYMSADTIRIQTVKFFMDPQTFDNFNYLFGTLSPENDNAEFEISKNEIDKLNDIMSCSYIVEDVIELKSIINDATNIILENTEKKYSPDMKILIRSFTNLRDAIMDNYFTDNSFNSDKNGIKVIIDTTHIYLFDSLVLYDENKSVQSFMCMIFKDVFFNKITENVQPNQITADEPLALALTNNNQSQIYSLKIKTGALIDTLCYNPEWKYFAKFASNGMLDARITVLGKKCKIIIRLNPFVANIREETLVRLLAFFSSAHHMPKNNDGIFIEYFNIGEIHLTLNYFPLVLKKKVNVDSDTIAIKDYDIILSAQIVRCVDNFDKLMTTIIKRWKMDVSPENIIQFIPNIKIIKPYTGYILYVIEQTSKYFRQKQNKKKIRAITSRINRGTDFVTTLIKYGLERVWDLFN
ncbi:MAG: hypothetical protein Satyrvirus20_4 [Satyrvirus sp.]|uniref:Uncharacterized protein n=1 Tax=Satyrvirus sp. TaxID=2487771 RepID=A0A3G5AE93_9VIRU|nr:MAG: hypothetical protein Satyrvirus20_4 [Satyrvirus sp.]